MVQFIMGGSFRVVYLVRSHALCLAVLRMKWSWSRGDCQRKRNDRLLVKACHEDGAGLA